MRKRIDPEPAAPAETTAAPLPPRLPLVRLPTDLSAGSATRLHLPLTIHPLPVRLSLREFAGEPEHPFDPSVERTPL